MKNTPFCNTRFAACLFVALLLALTLGSQAAWADEMPSSENDGTSIEHALLATDDDEAPSAQVVDTNDSTSIDDESTVDAEGEPIGNDAEAEEPKTIDTGDEAEEPKPLDDDNAVDETGVVAGNQSLPEGAAIEDANIDEKPIAADNAIAKATSIDDSGKTATAKTSAVSSNMQTSKSTSQAKTTSAAATQAKQTKSNPAGPLPDGDYIIRSFVSSRSVLDVAGGSKASGANAQLYSYNGTAAQKWKLTYDAATGFYTIVNQVAGKALDVSGGSTSNGANVQVWTSNGTKAQKWRIVKDGSEWRVESALTSHLVLDVAGANSGNGTNMQVYHANGTNAQRFDFVALKPAVASSTATIEEGAYVVTAGTGKVVDISGGSRSSGANVQQYASNSTYAQRFYLEPDGTGFYRIFNIGSGLALDVSGADLFPGANVQQYSWNGTAAQLWSLRKNSDGTVTLISKCNGLALDVSGASTANGANLQVYSSNGTKAQKFNLKKTELLSAGAVTLYSSGSINRVVDVKGASDKANATLQIYDANGSMAQRIAVTKTGSGYTLRPLCSGLYVAPSGSNVVQSSKSTTWTASFAKSGARRGIVLSTSGKAVTAASSGNSAALQFRAPSKSALQSFCPEATSLIVDGVYTVASAKNGKVLDIAGGSWQNGANIQVYASNNSGAQAFLIESAGNGWYRITNAMTGKAVDVAGARNANGTNVQQYDSNGTGAQLWKPVLSNTGQFVFVNKATGKALHVNGSNVDIWAKDGSSAQGWNLKASSFKYDEVVTNARNIIQGRSSGTNYYIVVDRGNTRTIVFQGGKNNWTPTKNWLVSVGAPSSATPGGDYTISGRGYSFDGALGGTPYTCYYWTNFLDNVYLFHSVPYHQGTWTVQDDRLGGKISHGCIRMATDNAKWIYDNIPNGTSVCIYN